MVAAIVERDTAVALPVSERDASWNSVLKKPLLPSDWLASVSFGEGLRRSVLLLRGHFRWYTLVFFVGGVGASLLLFPIDQILTSLAEGILAELLSPLLDFAALGNLILADLALMFLENFVVALVLFLLSCIAIRHAFRSVPSLEILRPKTPSQLSLGSVLGAGFLMAALLAVASLVFVAIPFLHALLLFTPVVLAVGSGSGFGAVRLSTQLRRQHWQRLLCALVASYVLNLFAGTLGGTMYLNLLAVLNLLHVSTGFLDPIFQIVFTQLPVAMVAPLLPLLSLVFYPSAMTTREDHLRSQFLRRQQQLQRQPSAHRPLPLEDTRPAFALVPDDAAGPFAPGNNPGPDRCARCGAALKGSAWFCHVCGASLSYRTIG
jgi:hypothetical protein